MNIQDEFDQIDKKQLAEGPAKTLMEKLKPLLSKSELYKKRWMWELLQNACDASATQAKFEINHEKKLIFKHNGKPFKYEETLNLIRPNSNKDDFSEESKSKIGQFGTGFISTHILSKKIEVKGSIEHKNKYFPFSFILDRTEKDNKDFLKNSIVKSKDELKECFKNEKEINNYQPENFNTEFIYDLSDSFLENENEIFKEGTKTLKKLLPFVFAFRTKLKKVTIKNLENTIIYTSENSENVTHTLCNNEKNSIIFKVTYQKATVAIPLQKKENTYEIQNFPEKTPVLYCAFPMVGTEDFNFPVIIHSENFDPNTERDGIAISEYNTQNREVLQDAKVAFEKLIEKVEKEKWSNTYHLFNIKQVNEKDYNTSEEKIWYENNIYEPIFQKLYDSKIVKISDSENNSLSEIYIPYVDKRKSEKEKNEHLEKIFSFAKEIEIQIQMPLKYKKWYDKINLENFKNEKKDVKLDLEKLLEIIAKQQTLSIDYLKKLIPFILETEAPDPEKPNAKREHILLNKYALIPNQKCNLCLQKTLKKDFISKEISNEQAEEIKDIAFALIGEDGDCRKFLLNDHFKDIADLIEENEKYELKELCRKIDETLREKDEYAFQRKHASFLHRLDIWYRKCELENKENLFPFYDEHKYRINNSIITEEQHKLWDTIRTSENTEFFAELAKDPDIRNKFQKFLSSPQDLEYSQNEQQREDYRRKLGEKGKEFAYEKLVKEFGEDRVEKGGSEYDFKILEEDSNEILYYVDVQATEDRIDRSLFLSIKKWNFLKEIVKEENRIGKYLIYRVHFRHDEDDQPEFEIF